MTLIEVTTDDNTVLVITNIDPISNVYNIETGLSVLRIERVTDPETSYRCLVVNQLKEHNSE